MTPEIAIDLRLFGLPNPCLMARVLCALSRPYLSMHVHAINPLEAQQARPSTTRRLLRHVHRMSADPRKTTNTISGEIIAFDNAAFYAPSALKAICLDPSYRKF